MAKFYVVPVEQEITVSGRNKEDAICNFATSMDTDMNVYFKVLSKEEYEQYKEARTDAAAHERFVKAFMKEELTEQFDVPEDEAEDVAVDAYDIYTKGDDKTEYDCIEEAYDNWLSEHEEDAEKDIEA